MYFFILQKSKNHFEKLIFKNNYQTVQKEIHPLISPPNPLFFFPAIISSPKFSVHSAHVGLKVLSSGTDPNPWNLDSSTKSTVAKIDNEEIKAKEV